jgi:hypothetical protein
MTRRHTYILRLWPFIALIGLLFACNGGNSSARLLPDAPPGWEEAAETKSFSGVALSDYVNGGAEAYLAYRFKQLLVREFRNETGARLTVEIYQMDSPENAYGIFSTDTAGEQWSIGADSSYGDGLLRFWKGPYFVRTMCFPPNASIEAVIRETGGRIAGSIGAESKRPDMLNFLPATNILPDTVCYFHRQTSLNNIRFLSDKNLLRLNDDVEALTWEERATSPGLSGSKGNEGRLRQILLRYPSATEARGAFENFTLEYLRASGPPPSGSPPLTAEMSETECAAANLIEHWVIVVLDAPSAQVAGRAVEQTKTRLLVLNQPEESL